MICVQCRQQKSELLSSERLVQKILQNQYPLPDDDPLAQVVLSTSSQTLSPVEYDEARLALASIHADHHLLPMIFVGISFTHGPRLYARFGSGKMLFQTLGSCSTPLVVVISVRLMMLGEVARETLGLAYGALFIVLLI
ncbi:hypothetical protein Tco_0266456 [Tanacetum coccineum]